MATSSIGARTVANRQSSIQRTDAPKLKKNRSWRRIESVQVCAELHASLVFLVIHCLLGLKKVKTQPPLKATLLPAKPEEDVLEYDELWSFVRFRKNKRWIWIVLCRRIRQVIAFVIGDRSAKTCQELWEPIPLAYRSPHCFSDFSDAYEKIFPEETHRSIGKESGQTNHVEH